MPVDFHIDEESDLLVATASGVVTADEVIATADKAFRESRGAGFLKNILFEIEKDAVGNLIDLNALFRIRRFMEDWGDKYPGRNVRTAFLLKATDDFAGKIEIWRAVAKEASNFKVEIRIMTDRNQALDWLTEPRKT